MRNNNYCKVNISEVESDLPGDIRDDALRVFRSAIADKCTIQDAINKVTPNHHAVFLSLVEHILQMCAKIENLLKVTFVELIMS